jgi:hypothetical protein
VRGVLVANARPRKGLLRPSDPAQLDHRGHPRYARGPWARHREIRAETGPNRRDPSG